MCSTAEIIDVVSSHQFALIKKDGKWEQIENSGRRRAEKEAIQATKNWEYTFDAVPDLVAIIDDKHRVVRANKAIAARLWMTSENTLLNQGEIEINTLLFYNLCLFLNKVSDIVFIHTKFEVNSKEKSTFNLPIKVLKSFKQQIDHLMNVP